MNQQELGIVAAAITTRVVCITRLGMGERNVLADRLMALEQQIFEDNEKEESRSILMGMMEQEVWIMLMETGGDLIGYNCIRFVEFEAQGRKVVGWKSRAAVLPAYRGRNRTAGFPAIMYRKYRMRHPFRPIYGTVVLLHPSSFKLLSDSMPRMYPYPKEQLSHREQAIFDAFVQKVGYQCLPGRRAFVIPHSIRAIQDEFEAKYWRENTHPSVAFFLRENPDYDAGSTLLSFFPIDLRLFIGMAWRSLGWGTAAARWINNLVPGGRRRAKVAMLRQHFPDLNVSEETLNRIAGEMSEVHLASGKNLIEAGQPQPNIYFLLSGSLLIHLATPRGLLLVDQMGPGAMLGEIGALLGIPATATVRSKGRSTLLKMGPQTIANLRRDEPKFLEHLDRIRAARMSMNSDIISGMEENAVT